MKCGLIALFACTACAVYADTAFKAGEWNVSFTAKGQVLRLVHPSSGLEVSGALACDGPAHAENATANPTEAWSVVDARDGVPQRLALVDTRGDVQGYLSFQTNGTRLSFLVYHRTALAYQGTLGYSGEIKCRADAFPCSTRPEPSSRVLQLASGDATSSLNDSLFSPTADEAVQFSAENLQLRSVASGRCAFEMYGSPDNPAQAEFSFNILRDYYKSRWVPYYRPIDRTRAPRPPTGWMSWNTYFDQAGSKENLAEARLGARLLKPFGLEFWSIESWQGNSPHLPVSNFHNMNLEVYEPQFPEGMKWLADEIRKLGFRPGLWTAPFGTGNDAFYAAHKDWFLHDADGKPIRCWNGKYTLDPTVAAAREHLTHIHDVAAHQWGYEFFKIDGMSGRNAGYCAHLYERPEIRARFRDPSCSNPFELCVQAFRKGIGPDRVFLACQGHFTGAEAAYADASRTGADIVHPNQPVKWANILLQARCTINQIFAHNVVFWADPDCLLVSQQALPIEEARVETTVVALPGQQMFAGDKLAELAPERVRLLQQALPVCDVRPAALYPCFGHLPVWNLGIRRPFGDWHVVALFNWSDQPARVGFDWDEIGEPGTRAFACWEFWTESWLGVNQSRLELQVPARAVRLVALQPAVEHPQFLSSDRHVTQGGVELKDQRWYAGRLTTTVRLVSGFPMTVRYTVPTGFLFQKVTVPDDITATPRFEAGGKVLAVTLIGPTTRDVEVALQF